MTRPKWCIVQRRVSAKAVGKAQTHYKQWARSIGAESGPKTLAGYYDLKYNDNKESRLYKGYVSAVNAGRISPLVKYDKFKEVDAKITSELDGLKTSDGELVKGHTAHFVDRIIGTHVEVSQPAGKELNRRLNHAAVSVEDARQAITTGRPEKVVTDAKGRKSQRFVGDNGIVTFNPDPGELIQTNRR